MQNFEWESCIKVPRNFLSREDPVPQKSLISVMLKNLKKRQIADNVMNSLKKEGGFYKEDCVHYC